MTIQDVHSALTRQRVRRTLRGWATFVGFFAIAIVLVFLSLSIGSLDVGVRDVLSLFDGGAKEDGASFAVMDIRAPRVALGFLTGASIALAGALLQTLSRNPLADPGLLGLSQGALVAVVLGIVFFPDFAQTNRVALALCGSLCTGLLILTLVGRSRTFGLSIILMGIAVETFLSAMTATAILHTPPALSMQISSWLNGSLSLSDWTLFRQYVPWALLTVTLIIFAGRPSRAYELGNDLASSIGEPVEWRRPLLLLGAVAISGAATATVGPLVFLGVLAPHLTNFLAQASGTLRLFLTAMLGGNLVVAADLLTRLTVVNLPVNFTLVAIGVPLFVIALRLRALRN